jgi:hypothetical protein
MPTKYQFDKVLSDGEQIARVWAEYTSFSLGEVTLINLQAKLTELRQKRDQIENLRMQLTALTNDLNQRSAEMANIVTRARSGFRATFGPDSSQYEQAGGTRSSERKRPKAKPTTPPTT